MTVCLAVTCHDPSGTFVSGIREAAPTLTSVFSSVAVNATAETSPATLAELGAGFPDALRRAHGAGTIGIGTARRDAVALALDSGASQVAYSDLDHVLRWAVEDPQELASVMRPDCATDMMVVGRSEAAFAAEPQRLQATEGPVNHAASLALGGERTDGHTWDFMIAVRLLSRACAALIVAESREESIASDVAWPMLAAARGMVVGYVAADGLAYRYRDDFGSQHDRRDGDALEWIRRLEIAAQHATALRPYL